MRIKCILIAPLDVVFLTFRVCSGIRIFNFGMALVSKIGLLPGIGAAEAVTKSVQYWMIVQVSEIFPNS